MAAVDDHARERDLHAARLAAGVHAAGEKRYHRDHRDHTERAEDDFTCSHSCGGGRPYGRHKDRDEVRIAIAAMNRSTRLRSGPRLYLVARCPAPRNLCDPCGPQLTPFSRFSPCALLL